MAAQLKLEDLKSWVKESGAIVITLIGVSLFVLLRLPQAVYYSMLGKSPEEVGLSYVEVLSQSSVGALAIILTIGALVILIATVLAFLAFSVRGLGTAPVLIRAFGIQMLVGFKLSDLDDEQYSLYRGVMMDIYQQHPELLEWLRTTLDEMMRTLDRIRQLERRAARTDEQEAELKQLRTQLKPKSNPFTLYWLLTRRWLSQHGRKLTLAVAATVLLLLLPYGGVWTASQVRNGHAPPHNLVELFALRGHPAELIWIDMQAEHSISLSPKLGEGLMYLGRNDKHLIFFDSVGRVTVRIPVDSVVVRTTVKARA